MDDDLEPLPIESDLPPLPDIHADDLLDLLTCESISDQVSDAISSPQLPSPGKTTEQWLIDQIGPIVEANACSPRKALLFPKTFSGLIAKHALDAHMSRLNISVGFASVEGTTNTYKKGAEKKSKKNQSKHGMTYIGKKCEQCGAKKKKCKCPQVIDASVVTTPSESFERKPEFCICVSERGLTSKNWIDREIEKEKAELSKEGDTELYPRTWEEHDTRSTEIETEIDNESLWTDSIRVVKHEDEKKRQ